MIAIVVGDDGTARVEGDLTPPQAAAAIRQAAPYLGGTEPDEDDVREATARAASYLELRDMIRRITA